MDHILAIGKTGDNFLNKLAQNSHIRQIHFKQPLMPFIITQKQESNKSYAQGKKQHHRQK